VDIAAIVSLQRRTRMSRHTEGFAILGGLAGLVAGGALGYSSSSNNNSFDVGGNIDNTFLSALVGGIVGAVVGGVVGHNLPTEYWEPIATRAPSP
jgi:hypothetical protein